MEEFANPTSAVKYMPVVMLIVCFIIDIFLDASNVFDYKTLPAVPLALLIVFLIIFGVYSLCNNNSIITAWMIVFILLLLFISSWVIKYGFGSLTTRT
jgi:hypothetical protein